MQIKTKAFLIWGLLGTLFSMGMAAIMATLAGLPVLNMVLLSGTLQLCVNTIVAATIVVVNNARDVGELAYQTERQRGNIQQLDLSKTATLNKEQQKDQSVSITPYMESQKTETTSSKPTQADNKPTQKQSKSETSKPEQSPHERNSNEHDQGNGKN